MISTIRKLPWHEADLITLQQRQDVYKACCDLMTLLTDAITQNRGPDEAQAEPRGDAVLVVPATFNTINKWAAGMNDTLALGLLNEALGSWIPIRESTESTNRN